MIPERWIFPVVLILLICSWLGFWLGRTSIRENKAPLSPPEAEEPEQKHQGHEWI